MEAEEAVARPLLAAEQGAGLFPAWLAMVDAEQGTVSADGVVALGRAPRRALRAARRELLRVVPHAIFNTHVFAARPGATPVAGVPVGWDEGLFKVPGADGAAPRCSVLLAVHWADGAAAALRQAPADDAAAWARLRGAAGWISLTQLPSEHAPDGAYMEIDLASVFASGGPRAHYFCRRSWVLAGQPYAPPPPPPAPGQRALESHMWYRRLPSTARASLALAAAGLALAALAAHDRPPWGLRKPAWRGGALCVVFEERADGACPDADRFADALRVPARDRLRMLDDLSRQA